MAFSSQQYIFFTIREDPNCPDLQQTTLQIGKWPNLRILVLGLTLLPHKRHGFVFDLLQKPKKGVFLLWRQDSPFFLYTEEKFQNWDID